MKKQNFHFFDSKKGGASPLVIHAGNIHKIMRDAIKNLKSVEHRYFLVPKDDLKLLAKAHGIKLPKNLL